MRQASATPEPRGIEEAEARAIIDASRSETGLPLHLAADFVERAAGRRARGRARAR